MEYSKLKNILDRKKIEVSEIASKVNMTPNGFRESVRKGTFPVNKLSELCKILEITPNEFFMNNTVHGSNNIVGVINSKVDARQYYSDSPDVLKAQIELLEERIKEKDSQIKEKDSQIKEKDSQIKEKDSQIKELLNILKNK